LRPFPRILRSCRTAAFWRGQADRRLNGNVRSWAAVRWGGNHRRSRGRRADPACGVACGEATIPHALRSRGAWLIGVRGEEGSARGPEPGPMVAGRVSAAPIFLLPRGRPLIPCGYAPAAQARAHDGMGQRPAQQDGACDDRNCPDRNAGIFHVALSGRSSMPTLAAALGSRRAGLRPARLSVPSRPGRRRAGITVGLQRRPQLASDPPRRPRARLRERCPAMAIRSPECRGGRKLGRSGLSRRRRAGP
jgi:hypothetical protein